MRRIYIDKTSVDQALAAITAQQAARNMFVNVTVKPYRGKKYDPKNTVVVVIG